MDKEEDDIKPPSHGNGQRSNSEQIVNLIVNSLSNLIKQQKFQDALEECAKGVLSLILVINPKL